MNLKIILILLVVTSLLSSCIVTETYSFSDSDFKQKKYKKFCVYSTEENIFRKGLIESYFVDILKDNDIESELGYEIFPATREWSESDFQRVLLDNNFDAFLKIDIEERIVYLSKIPLEESNTYIIEKKDNNGNIIYEEVRESDLDKRFSERFENLITTTLIDVKTNQIAWKAISETNTGKNSRNFEILLQRLSKEILSELETKEHIITN